MSQSPPPWLDLVETAIIVVDNNEVVTAWNHKATKLFGYSSQDVLGASLERILPGKVFSEEPFSAIKEGHKNCIVKILDVANRKGDVIHLTIKVSAQKNNQGDYVGAVFFADELSSGILNDQPTVSDFFAPPAPPPDAVYMDSCNSPIFVLDNRRLVTAWNLNAATVTGFEKEEICGKRFVSVLVDENDHQSTETMFTNAFEGKETPKFQLKINTKTGKSKYLLMNLTLQIGGESVLVLAQDVTEEVQKVQEISSVAEELRLLVDTASTPIFGIDLNGRINEWNNKAAEITGFTREEAMHNPLLENFIEPDFRESAQAILATALYGQGASNIHLEFRTKTLDPRAFLVNVTPRVAANTIVGVFGVAQDVTEAKRREKAISNMESELRQLINTANAPIFGIDIDGDVNEWNDKTAEITGFTKEEAFDKPLIVSFIVPALRHSVLEVMERALKGEETSNYELEFVTKSGEIRYLLVNVTTRRNAENDIVGAVGVAQDVTEAAQHDRAVAAMARELRQLVDTANAPIFGIDINGNVNEWNDKTAEITGFTGDEAFSRPLVDTFIVPKLRESVQEVLDNALKGRGTSNYELEFRTKSNEIRYLLVNATTRRDAENNIVGVVGVAQDVTEAAKHDRAVAAMANELRQLIDTANAPIFGTDVDGDVNEWNDKTAEITGFTKEEAFDCPLVETFIVPSLRESVQEVMDNALQGRGTSNYELEFRTKSNEIRHLLVNATTRRDAENNVVGVVGVAQDVTEAVQRDRAVAGMANELRQLIDTANAPIFGIDCEGNVNEWNNKTAEITGYIKEEAFDEPLVSKFIAPSLRKSVKEILDKGLRGHETANYELEFVTKSGEIRYLLVNATTRKDPENNIVGVVGVAQDVTEDRRHAQELREMQYLRASQEAKVETERNMTAYFAHELRNPLGAIDSALSAMPDEMPESAKSLIKGMQLCTGFMSSIMNNLLDVRKMEEGKMTLNSVAISLQSLLDSVHKMLLPSVRPGVAFLKICETKGKDWILGDAHRIQQVMTNVITNAIKYTTTGSITLIIQWEGSFVKFECADTGPGIPKGEQKKLFERFVQRGGAPGTGLGLAIAKHLVDLTKGSIRFESDPKLRPGTSCVVLMPLPMCDPPDVSMQVDDTSLMDDPISFLIIDDVKMNRMMLKRRIKKSIAPNAIIKEACTGEEALEICGRVTFDVVVVDQYMEEAGGVMVGTDVVFAMRRMRIESIIIGCSGNDMDEQFTEAGADWVWKKPMPSNSEIIADLKTAMLKRKLLSCAT